MPPQEKFVNPIPQTEQKSDQDPQGTSNETEKRTFKDRMKTAAKTLMIFTALSAGSPSSAQTSKAIDVLHNDIENTMTREAQYAKAEPSLRKLETLLADKHLGDKEFVYENEINSFIAQNLTVSPEQIQKLFQAITASYENITEGKITLIDSVAGKRQNEFVGLNNKLLDFLYKDGRSPFAEFDGPLAFQFENHVDAIIPDIEGKKIFNLVMKSKYFNLAEEKDEIIREKGGDGHIESGILAYSKDTAIEVTTIISEGSIFNFSVSVKDDQGKDFSYSFPAHEGSEYASYEDVKKVFLKHFEDKK